MAIKVEASVCQPYQGIAAGHLLSVPVLRQADRLSLGAHSPTEIAHSHGDEEQLCLRWSQPEAGQSLYVAHSTALLEKQHGTDCPVCFWNSVKKKST